MAANARRFFFFKHLIGQVAFLVTCYVRRGLKDFPIGRKRFAKSRISKPRCIEEYFMSIRIRRFVPKGRKEKRSEKCF